MPPPGRGYGTLPSTDTEISHVPHHGDSDEVIHADSLESGVNGAYSVNDVSDERSQLMRRRKNAQAISQVNLKNRATLLERIRDWGLQINPPAIRSKKILKIQAKYESLDYELTESEIELEERRKYSEVQEKWKSLQRWLLCALIGLFTGLIAFIIDTSIRALAKWKFGVIGDAFKRCVKDDCLVSPLLIWIAIDLLFVGIATGLVTFGSPIAAGSGIPEVKCYLNGIKMPKVVRLKTLLAKTVGVMFSVAGGLFVGKEGPMIHSGAVVGAGITQGKSTSLKFLNSGWLRRFRNDQEKRDFVSAGAAAGVSAAFGAPIGGVLFSLEEGSSFWNQGLTWRVFFAAMNATFFLNLFLSAADSHGTDRSQLSNPGLLNFGKFTNMPYNAYEMPLFMLIGIFGGLAGALFNYLNKKLTVFRMRYVHGVRLRALEALSVGLLTVAMSFLLMAVSSECLPLGDQPDANPIQLFCEDHQYSAMASLLFNTPEDSIKNLYHSDRSDFKAETLLLFGLTYFAVACVTYGIAVPSGLFVPCILTGAAWGRLLGTILNGHYPNLDWTQPGKYALIGSAAMLGGVVRMTISLTVIIIEATGNITYGLPIMLAVIFAKWVGDYFNEGLYDIHIELKHVPLLAWDPPQIAKHILTADDIMSRRIVAFYRVVKVGQLYQMLQSTAHSAFPIVEFIGSGADELATLNGIILRHQLVMILRNQAYGPKRADGSVNAPRMTFEDFRSEYPRYPDVADITVPPSDYDMYIDLKPYMNPSPYVVVQESTLSRIFRLFRTMGLRHLIVVNKFNQVVGLVTRKDLSNISSHTAKRACRPDESETEVVQYILPKDEIE